jgi:PAS domain S-box-containing protein
LVILKKLWHEVTNPRVEEEGGARQEYLTRVIYTLVSAGLLIMTTVVLVINYGIGEPNNESTLVMASMDILIVIGWLLIQNKHWRLSGYLLPFVFLMFSGYMVFTVGPVTTAVLQLAIAVLLAGMLSGNRARWIMLVICLVVYVAAGWGSGERDFELFLTSGILIFMSLGGIALLDWFFSNLLNKSLRTVREREVKLDSIFRAAPIGIGMVIDRVFQEGNQMLCQMTGYARDELVGQSTRMLYPSTEDYEYVGTEKYRLINEHGAGTAETRWKRKDGVIRDILLSTS